jgi:hypothetical protein
VTVAADDRRVADEFRTGVCVVRAETLSDGLLVTVLTNIDVSDPDGDWVRRTVDVAEALDEVRKFFRDMRN